MQKTLFLCSRMAPFGITDLRSELSARFGKINENNNTYRLHVEYRNLKKNEDVRLFCARAIQSSDAVVLVLDGSKSSVKNPLDAPVLELEVMLAASCAKPVFVIDGSDGTDPLFRLLGTEFFTAPETAKSNVIQLKGMNPLGKVAQLYDLLAQTCDGKGLGAAALAEHVGWERLFLARPDRINTFDEDGGNFPFSLNGLRMLDMEISNPEITVLIEKAEASLKVDKMESLVFTWDAIRALSTRPWNSSDLDHATAMLWLRALSNWGGSMAWLGLFGHSSGAAIMTNLACRRIASRIDSPNTRIGGRFALPTFLGGLASTYFSLSKLIANREVQLAMSKKGIQYATDGLKLVRNPVAQAGLLAVRGPLLLSTRSAGKVFRGFQDLHESIRLHQLAYGRLASDQGTATSRIQLGAAYKELSKQTLRDPITLRLGRFQLEAAYETLHGAYAAGTNVDLGQLLMCMKHLTETLWLLRKESQALEIWHRAMSLGHSSGIADQLRQIQDIGRLAGWITAK